MYYMNINKNLLGKTPFTVSKNITTKAEFRKRLKSIIQPFFPGEDIDDSEGMGQLESIIANQIPDEMHIPVPKELVNLYNLFGGKETIKNGVCFVDMDSQGETFWEGEYDDNNKLCIIDKFPFVLNYSSIGDDGLTMIASILYFDENDNLAIYVPTYGNTLIPELDLALGGYDYDTAYEDYFDALIAKHQIPEDVTSFLGDELEDSDEESVWNVKCLMAYQKEHGIKKVRHNDLNLFNDPGSFWITNILVSKRLIKEDIKSNMR